MNLIEKQKKFSTLLARFILDLEARGYEVTMGEAWRPPETASLYASRGLGTSSSLHCVRLAADLNLFRNGSFLRRTNEYLEAGELWESYSSSAAGELECCWGGRFGDGNHFSIGNAGIK